MKNLVLIAWLVALAMPALSGCAVHRFDLVEPAEFAGVIDEPLRFAIVPAEYLAAPARGGGLARGGGPARLGLRIENNTGEPLTLIGERSWLVDPSGESHAIRGGLIAPHSHITMMLPPEPMVVESFGPRFGVGVGVGRFHRRGAVGFGIGRGWPYDHWHSPRRHYFYDPDRAYWQWREGIVRLRLAYEHDGELHEHDLAFERVRVQ